ncbi:hypothetical protein L873DRAFT_1796292 [Choiromyces venosus 120613-1]|uniref:Uncharacterized protein n=1 Tax=Choiromyces venosus 120613-1 TaxID=1336337 RepID=A0A3N4ITI9_9PEZI|nr:hypothetical protein L873DRAFT_1796292 [Choiromyces venosus 120613-1]
MPQGPPSLKRPCSNTPSSLLMIPNEYLVGASPDATYFQNPFIKVAVASGLQTINPTPETVIFCKMMEFIHDDYRNSITTLEKYIDMLGDEVDELWQQTPPPPEQPTTTSAPPDTYIALESTSSPVQTQPPLSIPAPAAVGAPSWVTVVRKGKKKAPSTQKPALAAKPATSANVPAPKKGITMRERRLVINAMALPSS